MEKKNPRELAMKCTVDAFVIVRTQLGSCTFAKLQMLPPNAFMRLTR
jgi:hypothetical protein